MSPADSRAGITLSTTSPSGSWMGASNPAGSGTGSGSVADSSNGSIAGLSALAGSATPSASQTAPAKGAARSRYDAEELREICARYEIGKIQAVREFRRGSSRSPKVIVETNRGEFLLKRRSISLLGVDGLARVRQSHAVQALLAAKRFPLPPLMPTREEWSTITQRGDHVYELFAYVTGNPYDGSLDGAMDAGALLAGLHTILAGQAEPLARFAPWPLAHYHRARGLEASFEQILAKLGEGSKRVVDRLRVMATHSARMVDAAGLADWPSGLIHADWHPGNMLFSGSRIVAVIDYDTLRLAPRIIDIANGAMQFAMVIESSCLAPSGVVGLDQARFKRFFRGYESIKGAMLSEAELRIVPWLMIEALIVEAAAPIALTGRFGHLDGLAFLQLADAKAAWLAEHASRLSELILQ
jgi:Ser/Thr protein kinase RdoA (MazF antagonist)